VAPKVSAENARLLLIEHGHDIGELVPLTGGFWSATFAFTEGGRDYVVRFHERRDDLEKDRFAMRWASPRLRVPRIVEIADTPLGPYGISERARGSAIDDLDAAGMREILPALFTTLDAIREASVSGTTGFGLWHGDGNAPGASWRATLLNEDGTGRARATLVGSPVGTTAFDAGVSRIRELVDACPEARHVVHNDLLYRNVFHGPDGIVMLDWGASIYGDFLYDMALLTIWWPFYASRWRGIEIRAEIERHYAEIGLGIPHFAERLRCYELDIATSHIASQGGSGMWDVAAWTARRTADLAKRDLGSSD
jgi:hygromycin-B 4-O-kinase